MDWLKYFVTQNPQFDWTTITPVVYQRFWDQSLEQYGLVIGTDNPDLTEFRNRGGKAIVWHGWSDQLISAEGTTDYYNRVIQTMGGADKTSQFIRLFMAPGVGHCYARFRALSRHSADDLGLCSAPKRGAATYAKRDRFPYPFPPPLANKSPSRCLKIGRAHV